MTIAAEDLLARFGAKLTTAARAAGLDAKALGDALASAGLGSPPAAARRVRRYLAGQSMPPSAKVWVVLAAAVGVDPGDLMAG